MKVLFWQDHLLNESLPLTELVALLRERGHEAELLIEREEPCFLEKGRKWQPQLLCIPADVGNEAWVAKMVKVARQKLALPILLIGSLPTLDPGFAKKLKADYYICGEVEKGFLFFLESFKRGEMSFEAKGIYSWSSLPEALPVLAEPWLDLDSLPMPARDIYFKYPALGQFPVKRFLAGRGCPLRCSFCYIAPVKKLYKGNPYLRVKSPERLIEEILWVRKRYPLSFLHFPDDTFTWHRKWVLEFCELYAKKVRLPFDCNTVASFLDETVLDALKSANCKGVAVGVEVSDEKTRVEVLNKPVRNSTLLELARQLKKREMKLITYNMIGLPGRDIRSDLKTVAFNRKLGVALPRVQIAYPMPGTAFEKKERKGLPAAARRDGNGEEGALPQLKRGFPLFVRFAIPGLEKILGKKSGEWVSFLGALYGLWKEWNFYELPFLSALKLYLRTGGMEKRTKNINLFLP